MASFPQLLDVGIMGHCEHGATGLCIRSGVECYQSGRTRYEPNMSIDDFRRLARECTGRTFQFALGGRGDPDMHEAFEEILVTSRQHGIVPNLTTSGLRMTSEKARIMKDYCGAVAVSWYRSEYTIRAIHMLLDAGVTTNVHFVLSNRTIDEAIDIIKNNKIPEDVGRVIFLLHKPVGLGRKENVLSVFDPRVQQFFGLFNDGEKCTRAGFDSCSVPGLLNMAPRIHPATIEPCEGGRFSAYITPDMRITPCSFDQELRWAVDLREASVETAWNSTPFEAFRDLMRLSCPGCRLHEWCLGGCPVVPEITLCGMLQGGLSIENPA